MQTMSRHQPRQREYGSNFHLQASLLQWEGARSPSLPKEEQLSQAHSILFNYINLLFQCINTIYHPIATHAQSLSHPMTLSPIYLVHYYLICTFPMSLLYTLQPIPALYSKLLPFLSMNYIYLALVLPNSDSFYVPCSTKFVQSVLLVSRFTLILFLLFKSLLI